MRGPLFPTLSTLLALILAGCGADDEATPTASGPTSAAIGPGLTVSQARSTDTEGPLLVRGALLVDEGKARLCSRLAESMPPQCGGDSLEVEGLDLTTISSLQRSGNVRWTGEVALLGEVEGDELVVSGDVTG